MAVSLTAQPQVVLMYWGQGRFGLLFDVHETTAEVGVVGQGFQSLELGQVRDPGITDGLGDQVGQGFVGFEQPTPLGDAVGDGVEALGVVLGEVGYDPFPEQAGVDLGHTVDGVGADDGQVGHAHQLLVTFLDDAHAGDAVDVAGVAAIDLVDLALVDLVDDLQVAGQQPGDQVQGPLLEGLGHEGVVGVGEGTDGQVPGMVPGQVVDVHQQAHQLRHGQRGVGVVELDGHQVGEAVPIVGVQHENDE